MATRQSFGLSKCIFNILRTNNADSLGRRGFTRIAGAFIEPGGSSLYNVSTCGVNNNYYYMYAPVRLNNSLIRFYSTDDKKPKLGLADEILSSKIAREQTEKEEEGGEKKEEKKKAEPLPKWQKYGYIFLGVTMVGSLIANAILFSLPDQDEMGNDIEDEFSSLTFPSQNYYRLKNKVFTTKKAIEEPFSDKLLPDQLEPPYYQPKYTIVIELTGLMVNSNWTHKHGWRFQKRPGLDMFLSQVGFPNFELVVWTVENSMTFFPILLNMDPEQRHIMYRLFRDATQYKDGAHIKELSKLNRDLKNVIVVDWNKDHIQHNPDNALILKKWDGDNSDRTLIGLAQFLHTIKDSDVDDVRDVLTYYRQFEDPIEAFRENQRKLEDDLRVQEENKLKEKESSRFSSFSGVSSFNIFKR
jgi:import inner membrane translocase subunit TIM50